MNKKTQLLILFIFLTLLTLTITSCTKPCKPTTCLNDACYEIEIPKTPQEMMQGLMHRTKLPENQGMLFIFQEEQKHGFWMKNTLIPLDIIWINKDLEIVHIEHAKPCKQDPCPTYEPQNEAIYVLEINQNQTTKHNVNTGTKITMNLCENT